MMFLVPWTSAGSSGQLAILLRTDRHFHDGIRITRRRSTHSVGKQLDRCTLVSPHSMKDRRAIIQDPESDSSADHAWAPLYEEQPNVRQCLTPNRVVVIQSRAMHKLLPGRRYRHLWLDAYDVEGRPVRAVTYIADGLEADGNPSLRYLTLLRDGARAHGLPDHWLRFLDGVKAAE